MYAKIGHSPQSLIHKNTLTVKMQRFIFIFTKLPRYIFKLMARNFMNINIITKPTSFITKII